MASTNNRFLSQVQTNSSKCGKWLLLVTLSSKHGNRSCFSNIHVRRWLSKKQTPLSTLTSLHTFSWLSSRKRDRNRSDVSWISPKCVWNIILVLVLVNPSLLSLINMIGNINCLYSMGDSNYLAVLDWLQNYSGKLCQSSGLWGLFFSILNCPEIDNVVSAKRFHQIFTLVRENFNVLDVKRFRRISTLVGEG